MKSTLITLNLLFMVAVCDAQSTYKRSMQLMACNFDITVIADTKKEADNFIDLAIREMTRIENLISSWDSNSQTSEINKNAGIKPVIVDAELFELIQRAQAISKISDGAFDISYASLDRIWKFDGSLTSMPSEEAIINSVAKIGYRNVILNPTDSSVFLTKEGMKIGFGAIGKGYAADKAKALLQDLGVIGGIINASGDMNTWGKQLSGEDWKIAITNPMNKNESYGLLPLEKGAVVTSGNYEKYALINGKRYSHIIDPRTGMPTNGILSVTVFAPSAELADALATSVFVMGIDVGLHRIGQLKNVECIIVDERGELHFSDNIQID